MDTVGAATGADGVVDESDLRPALEAAINHVRTIRRQRPVPPYPTRLRTLLDRRHLSRADLRMVCRELDRDDVFRQSVGAALDTDAHPIARLWLVRPDGWETELAAEIASRHVVSDESKGAAAERRRRDAAERRADRAEADLAALTGDVSAISAERDELVQQVADLNGQLDELRSEVASLRTAMRHSEDRRAAAQQREQRATEALAAERDARHGAEQVRDSALVDRAATDVDRRELDDAVRRAHEATTALRALVGPVDTPTVTRAPLAMPGRLTGRGAEQAEHLLRAGATVLVDAYNVTLTHRGDLTLEQQRDWLVQRCEQLTSRWATDLIVVFDGDAVPGAHTAGRRRIAVLWSPAGVDADDVIRDEVARLPVSRAVVVVTDDRAVRDDVRAMGCNLIDTASFVSVLDG